MNHYCKSPRYLISFNSKKLGVFKTPVLIIGSGIAGLRAALEAARSGPVILITKSNINESNTFYAQGGIAGHINNPALVNSHIKDTIQAGQGLSNPATVKFLIPKSIPLIKELIRWGLHFDGKGNHPGRLRLDLAHEGGHSHPRILHAGGDNTGLNIVNTLVAKVRNTPQIKIMEYQIALDLLTIKISGSHETFCVGALVYDNTSGEIKVLQSKKTILATGGLGQIYRETTNPELATGDGIALAYRAGAVLQDLEFIQFHPTAFYVAGASRTLISETVRGAGGLLRDKNGYRFMPDYHPRAELAPRDVVARSIINQMKLTNDTSIYLDLTHLDTVYIRKRFPGLDRLCKNFDIDITKDFIPVRPSAHYLIGGIKINRRCETNLKNLYAAGEVAASGFHGANRLGSNSLLEGLVLGQLAGASAGKIISKKGFPELNIHSSFKSDQSLSRLGITGPIRQIDIIDVKNSLRSLMWREVGLNRTAAGLQEALKKINFWCGYIMDKKFTEPSGWELQNMLTVAGLVTTAALKRTESRGVHYRSDFPETDNKNFQRKFSC